MEYNLEEKLNEKLNSTALKAVLFDMDGVLFDSMKNHAEAWAKAMEQHGLSMTRKEVYMNEGRTGEGTIDIFTQRDWGRDATEQEILAIYKTKSDIFNTLPTVLPMQGAAEVLDNVRKRGLMRILVTGSGQVSLLERLENAYPGHFKEELMVTAFDVKHGKPYPEPYLMGLEKAGRALGLTTPLPASQAVVVENAPLGIQAAKAAGIFCIAVNTGPLEDQILYDAGADIVLPGMAELAEKLK
ncbi:MAG: HAD hydrolase-like protein [Bacteroidaceae bacterium]|nr:HAD hydrolase-like protein [Bacteroidaceae bacterium]